jgi:hypothetical protein
MSRSAILAALAALLAGDGAGNILANQSPAQFDNSLKLATTAWVKANGESFSGVVGIGVSSSLTASAHLGAFLFITVASTTQTLPPISSAPSGSTVTIAAPVGAIVKGNAAESINSQYSAPANTFALAAGEVAQFVSNGAGWYVASYTGTFAASIGASGYQKLPSGLIIQWGAASTTSGNANMTFPIAFPNACRSVVAIESGAAGWSASNTTIYGIYNATPAGFGVKSFTNIGGSQGPSSGNFYWQAIGN